VDDKNPIPDDLNPPRYIRRDAAYALQPCKPIDWVIKPIISRGSVNVFFGEPGSKKTYSMLSMAVCVAKGQSGLEMPTRRCKVLIIDEESGENRLSIRLAATLRGEEANEETPLEFISLAGFLLDNPKDQVLVENEIKVSGAGLVIFDALADLMTGEEN
jgi:hypothetical protein